MNNFQHFHRNFRSVPWLSVSGVPCGHFPLAKFEDLFNTGLGFRLIVPRNLRCLRGGSWSFDQVYTRAVYRNYDYPINRYVNVGFRVVCVGGPPVRRT